MATLKRSKFLVDPQVQWAIGRRVIQHWALFAFCLLTINATFLLLMTVNDPIEDPMNAAALSQLPVLTVLLVMLPIFVVDTVRLTNRFAGPMSRLRLAIGEMLTQPDIKPIKFRKGDFWMEMADDFNRLVEHHASLHRRNEELEEALKTALQEHELQVA